MQQNQNNPLEYARPPRSMSRGRLALLVGAAAGAGVIIGGIAYSMQQPPPPAVISGDVIYSGPVFVPQNPGGKPPTSQPEK